MTDDAPLTTPDAILRAALEKERAAYAFYTDHAALCRIDMVREFLERLGDEEHKHIRMIEDMLAGMRLGHDI